MYLCKHPGVAIKKEPCTLQPISKYIWIAHISAKCKKLQTKQKLTSGPSKASHDKRHYINYSVKLIKYWRRLRLLFCVAYDLHGTRDRNKNNTVKETHAAGSKQSTENICAWPFRMLGNKTTFGGTHTAVCKSVYSCLSVCVFTHCICTKTSHAELKFDKQPLTHSTFLSNRRAVKPVTCPSTALTSTRSSQKNVNIQVHAKADACTN